MILSHHLTLGAILQAYYDNKTHVPSENYKWSAIIQHHHHINQMIYSTSQQSTHNILALIYSSHNLMFHLEL